MNARFLAIAQDPTIIHGVHHHCDEWCDYCSLTARCLGFRCTEAFMEERGRRRRHPAFAAFANTEEAVAFSYARSRAVRARALAAAEPEPVLSKMHQASAVDSRSAPASASSAVFEYGEKYGRGDPCHR